MAYEFHYTPTGTGVISGKEVLEQTEDAINDLGNTAISGVQEALDKAEQALTNSADAVDDAQTALNTANNAEGVAIQAQNDVSNLSGTVTNIGNRVTTAEGNITNLQGRMTTAEGNITNLQGRMTTAEGNIGNLQTAVSTAQATANSAQQTATTARQQSYVLRYSSSSITDNSTISYSTLDNTDNIKSGDKVIDVDGKIFTVVSVDTANQTVTVGSALIDLAKDSDVVHKSEDETVGGVKSFINYFFGKDLSGQTVDLNDCVDAHGGAIHYYYAVLNYTNISNKPENKPFILESKTVRYVSSVDYIYYQKIYTADYNTPPSVYTRYYRSGSASWSNWVKDTDKFVTTDTDQTISGNKTFNGETRCVGELNQTAPFKMTSDTSFAIGTKNTRMYDLNGFQCVNEQIIYNANKNIRRAWAVYNNSSGTTVLAGFTFILSASGQKVFYPLSDNDTDNGSSSAYWKNTYTKLINGLTPSSLSLPTDNMSNIIDISGYLTVLDGSSANTYPAPNNGYISITMNNCSGIQAYITGFWGNQIVRPTAGALRFFMPICKNMTANILIFGGTVDNAGFFPCQGNI